MDLISFNGPTFKNWDNRVAALRLVQKNLCDAALFDPSGNSFTSSPFGVFLCCSCHLATTCPTDVLPHWCVELNCPAVRAGLSC